MSGESIWFRNEFRFPESEPFSFSFPPFRTTSSHSHEKSSEPWRHSGQTPQGHCMGVHRPHRVRHIPHRDANLQLLHSSPAKQQAEGAGDVA